MVKLSAATRLWVLIGVLIALLLAWEAVAYENRAIEAQLAPLVKRRMDENRDIGVRLASTTTISRKYVLFGEPLAKIEIFVKPLMKSPNDVISAIEYHYRREDGVWKLEDSARCTSQECQIRGRAAFKSLSD